MVTGAETAIAVIAVTLVAIKLQEWAASVAKLPTVLDVHH